MSKSTKWIIAVLVIVLIVIALWWSGIFGLGSSGSQSAAVVNHNVSPSSASAVNTNTNSATDAIIAANISAIDTQLVKANADLSAMGTAPTAAAIAADALEFKNAASIMSALSTAFQTRLTNAKTTGNNVTSAQASLADMTHQLQNGSSQAQAAANAAAVKQPTTAQLKAAQAQLNAAKGYLATARKDAGSIVQALASMK